MEKKRSKKRASFQIVATFIVLISAYLLVSYVFIAQTKEDVLKYESGAKAGTVIEARKTPEYAKMAAEQGAYQAEYEVGIRGGYDAAAIAGADSEQVKRKQGSAESNVPAAVWADSQIAIGSAISIRPLDKAPAESTVTTNLLGLVKSGALAYLSAYLPAGDPNYKNYEASPFTLSRAACTSTQYAGIGNGCFDAAILNPKQTQKKMESQLSAETTSSANAHFEIRFFKMYDLLRSFVKNDFIKRTGKTPTIGEPFNLLAQGLEHSFSSYLTTTFTQVPDTDTKTTTVEYYPGRNDCTGSGASGPIGNAKIDYSCCPALITPACAKTVRGNLENAIKAVEENLNKEAPAPLSSEYDVKCPAGAAGCESGYNGGARLYRDVANTAGDNIAYREERFKWELMPTQNNWKSTIRWYPDDPVYTVLWWDQSGIDGRLKLPDGYNYLRDTRPPEGGASGNNNAYDNWDPANFPEGTAACDSYSTDCHQFKTYQTHFGCSTGYADCEEESYDNDPAGHRTLSGCSAVRAGGGTYHYVKCCSYSYWEGCTSYGCCGSYSTGVSETNSWQAHCDVTYKMSGHFKYRAEVNPLLVTITDESKAVPVKDIFGQNTLAKPSISMVYKSFVYEEPKRGDGCVDEESEEGLAGSRYYFPPTSSNPLATINPDLAAPTHPCPTNSNPSSPKGANYYTLNPACSSCTVAGVCDIANRVYCDGTSWKDDSTNEYCNNCKTGPNSHCNDGVQNCGETGTDTGGSCPCTAGTCDIANKRFCNAGTWDSNTNAGSLYCNNCATIPNSHCNDGVQNCGESGVDKGGGCPTSDCTQNSDCASTCCGKDQSNNVLCVSQNTDTLGNKCRDDCECPSGSVCGADQTGNRVCTTTGGDANGQKCATNSECNSGCCEKDYSDEIVCATSHSNFNGDKCRDDCECPTGSVCGLDESGNRVCTAQSGDSNGLKCITQTECASSCCGKNPGGAQVCVALNGDSLGAACIGGCECPKYPNSGRGGSCSGGVCVGNE